jgi:CheY-like chemotaxis protein
MSARILVVDNDRGVGMVLSVILKEAGYQATVCTTATEALEVFRKEIFDLVIMDAHFPDMRGSDLCRRLLDDYDGDYLPVIVTTAASSSSSVIEMLRAGARDYILKPFDTQDVTDAIQRLLNKAKRRSDSTEDAVAVHFDFPEAVKVPCQQYLLYFVEFLKDIGIEATANLQDDAGHVLFSVIPKDKDEALDNIWEALQIYLRLPMSRGVATVSTETSIEVQRLSAELGMFQSRLMLAGATIQQQNATIQNLQQQVSSGQILIQSLQQDEGEPLGTELVKVKPWAPEWLPIEVDLPSLIRILKERIRLRRLPPPEE